MEMFLGLVCSALFASPGLSMKVVGASLFKNGYAVVVREAALGGSGEKILDEVPNATLGTLWITASPGVKFQSVVATTVPTSTESPVASLDEFLKANEGKTLGFKLSTAPDALQRGKLLSYSGDTAILQTENETFAINRGLIQWVVGDRGLQWKKTVQGRKPAYRFMTESPPDGELYILSLERGLTWAPAYLVDISDPKKLSITSKATILNEFTDLDNLEVRLITGFPNVPYITLPDPFSLSVSFDQFTGALMNAGTPDAMRRSGGFGGQMMQNSAPMSSFSEAFNISNLPGIQSEDLFFYRQPGVTLKRGDRGFYILFKSESAYEHIYTWDVADQVVDNAYRPNPQVPQDEVWHSLKFKNESKQPWTTAPAVTVKDDQVLGQDMLTYTTVGTETLLKITKALDVKAEASEIETSRAKESIVIAGYNYIEVTLKGTLQIRNLKSEAVKLRVKKELSGTVVSSTDSPEVVAIPKGLQSINPTQCLTWHVDLKAGDKKELTYVYKVLIRP